MMQTKSSAYVPSLWRVKHVQSKNTLAPRFPTLSPLKPSHTIRHHQTCTVANSIADAIPQLDRIHPHISAISDSGLSMTAGSEGGAGAESSRGGFISSVAASLGVGLGVV